MTLIVGVLCSDGVVVAADSAATMAVAASGMQTISQPTDKITILKGSILLACAGSVGLSQQFREAIEQICGHPTNVHTTSKTPAAAAGRIATALRPIIEPEMRMAQVARNVVGPSAASNAVCLTMIAMPIAGSPALMNFGETGSPEVATDHLQFFALGSGQMTADPFLAFIRDRFWKGRQPSLSEGTFAAYWTLSYTIAHTPGGIAAPIHVASLYKKGASWVAEKLSEAQLGEHADNIAAIEKHISEYPLKGPAPEDPLPTSESS